MLILESGTGNYILSEGIEYSCFAGNNYLGLANDPVLIEAAIQGTKKYGLNFSASRQTTGTADIHLGLERQLAEFKRRDDAVVFASGYLGNKILLHVLKEEYDAIFTDQSAHSSIRIREKSPAYGASTALPPPLVSAACAAIKLITGHPELRQRVLLNAARIRDGINQLGFLTS